MRNAARTCQAPREITALDGTGWLSLGPTGGKRLGPGCTGRTGRMVQKRQDDIVTPCRPSSARKPRGAALMITLWVTAALSVLLGTVFMQSRALTSLTVYQKDCVEAEGWCLGGLNRLIALVHAKRSENQARVRGDFLGAWQVFPPVATEDTFRWGQINRDVPSGAGKFNAAWDVVSQAGNHAMPEATGYWIWGEIEAEDAKLSVNNLQDDTDWTRIPNITQPLARGIVAERQTAPFTSLEDLLARVEALTPERFRGTSDTPGFPLLFTTWSDGKVYLNRARREVIIGLPGVDDTLAQEIVAKLNKAKTNPDEYFQRVEDLQHVMGVTPAIYGLLKDKVSVVPAYYRVRVTACVNGIIVQREAVVFVARDGRNLNVVATPGG